MNRHTDGARFRVAFIAVGALMALVGGAATASWGLSPLTAPLSVEAPQMVSPDASPIDTMTAGATQNQTTAQSNDVAAPVETTRVAYAVPPSPPADVDPDGPRQDSEPVANGPEQQDSASGLDLPLGGENAEASAGRSTATVGAASHNDAEGDTTTSGGSNAVGAGPN